jgi:hypothetical protein
MLERIWRRLGELVGGFLRSPHGGCGGDPVIWETDLRARQRAQAEAEANQTAAPVPTEAVRLPRISTDGTSD